MLGLGESAGRLQKKGLVTVVKYVRNAGLGLLAPVIFRRFPSG